MMRRDIRKNGDLSVRYDGTETKLQAECWADGRTLTEDELRELIETLQDALVERRAFEKSFQSDILKMTTTARPRRQSARAKGKGGGR